MRFSLKIQLNKEVIKKLPTRIFQSTIQKMKSRWRLYSRIFTRTFFGHFPRFEISRKCVKIRQKSTNDKFNRKKACNFATPYLFPRKNEKNKQ